MCGSRRSCSIHLVAAAMHPDRELISTAFEKEPSEPGVEPTGIPEPIGIASIPDTSVEDPIVDLLS